MPPKIDMTGKTCGRLHVIKEHPDRLDGRVRWRCACECGKLAVVAGKHLRSGEVSSCGCLHVESSLKNLPNNQRPLGFRRVTRKGYIEIKTFAGYKREHVFIMESLLGRSLDCHEVVHHVDGNKANNDISNLQLMSHGEHTSLHNKLRNINK